ncbi:MAG: S-layer homology domain-containing protein [Eubacteriales bacterium]|nr:S-layer homology domain-containing protein [Eubacteriales bacterium]
MKAGRKLLATLLALVMVLSMMPAANAEGSMPGKGSYGNIDLTLSLTKSGSNYTATYTAKTTMMDWLAEAAAVAKDDGRLAKLLFTCTLKDALTAKLSDVSTNDYEFTSAMYNGVPIFDPVSATVEGGAIKLSYKLNSTVLSAWSSASAENVKSALMSEMTMTASKSVSASVLSGLGRTIATMARIDITSTDGKIPFYHETSILAAQGNCSIGNPEYTTGGGGTTTPTNPVIIKDGGTVETSKSAAATGEEVTVTIKPDEGEMINYVAIRDKDGNKVPLSYEGQGSYTFIMPEGGVTVTVTFRQEPADPAETGVAAVLDTDSHIAFMIGDDEGMFRPNDNINRAEVSMIFYRLLREKTVEQSASFADVSSQAWYAEAVETLAAIRIVKGVGENTFEPMRSITRAEFAAICARFAKALVGGKTFADVNDHWAAEEISTAAFYGWIYGYEDGTFAPDKPITRQEAAAIVNRMLYRLGDQIAIDDGHTKEFQDVTDNMWSWYEIAEATYNHDHEQEDKFAHEFWEE